MTISTHVLTNTAMSIPLKYTFGWSWQTIFLFVMVGGVLIDVDHLFYFAFKHKTLSPKAWASIGKKMRSKMLPGLYVFHSPEFNVLLLLFASLNPIILIIFMSNLIHLTLDIIEHYKYHKNFLWIKHWSIVYSLIG